MAMTDQYKPTKKTRDERYMFKGLSCYPLSPCESAKEANEAGINIVDKEDMLIKILEYMEPLDKLDKSFLTTNAARSYVKKLDTDRSRKSLAKRFDKSSPELVELLQKMLVINPYFRSSAAELLKLPLFDKIRVPNLEAPAPKQLFLTCD